MRTNFSVKLQANLPAMSYRLRDNEIIILFENKKVGQTGGLHLSVGVKCIERLAKLLWYT